MQKRLFKVTFNIVVNNNDYFILIVDFFSVCVLDCRLFGNTGFCAACNKGKHNN